MSSVVSVTDQTFDIEVLDKSLIRAVAVYFWADFSQESTQLFNGFVELCAELGFQACSVNVAEQRMLNTKWSIRSLPAVLVFYNRESTASIMGNFTITELRRFLNKGGGTPVPTPDMTLEVAEVAPPVVAVVGESLTLNVEEAVVTEDSSTLTVTEVPSGEEAVSDSSSSSTPPDESVTSSENE